MSIDQARKLEASDALPLGGFYIPPTKLAMTHRGDLLRHAPFTGYALPAGVRAERILYHSRAADGRDVAASGVVLVPPGDPPRGGWPVIAWAHGTSGVARQCAPSLMRDLYYGEEGLFPMVRAGYAVVATDYHGLGTAGPHEYLNKRAQAYDVVYSVLAARGAVATLGRRWVVVGHSQGGTAAWGVAELEHSRRDLGYLGAIAVAPGSLLRESLGRSSAAPQNGFYLDYIAWAIGARTPSFKPTDMLTGPALARYPDLTSAGCFYYGYASFSQDTGASPLKAGWELTPGAQRFFTENELGSAPIEGPLLVIAGEADRTVPVDLVRRTVAAACRRGLPVELRTYPGLDHDPTMDKSTPDQLAWITARFHGDPAQSNCDDQPGPG